MDDEKILDLDKLKKFIEEKEKEGVVPVIMDIGHMDIYANGKKKTLKVVPVLSIQHDDSDCRMLDELVAIAFIRKKM